jgi:hypothetical protein
MFLQRERVCEKGKEERGIERKKERKKQTKINK